MTDEQLFYGVFGTYFLIGFLIWVALAIRGKFRQHFLEAVIVTALWPKLLAAMWRVRGAQSQSPR